MSNHYFGRLCVYDRDNFKPSHGPQTWPWWRLISISVVTTSHDPDCLFWNIPNGRNIWIYTRWYTVVYHLVIIKGVYIANDLWNAALTRWHEEYERTKQNGR